MTYPYRTKQERELRRNYESLRTKRKFQLKVFFLNAVTILGFLLAALALTAMFYSFTYIVLAQ